MASTLRNRKFGRTSEEAMYQRELDAEADAEAADNWDDPTWRRQMHTDLAEVIWLGFQHTNLIESFATVETAAEFDRITFDEVTGLEVFFVSLGGQIDMTVLDEHVWEMQPVWVGYHVSALEDHIRSGFSRYIRRLAPLAVMQMDAAINSRMLRTFQAAIPGPSSTSYVTSVNFDLNVLNAALTAVEDAASGWPSLTGMPSDVAIVGRPAAVDSIMNALQSNNNFAPETQQSIIDTGIIGYYRGAKVIKLRNWKDRNGVAYFPGNELEIISNAAAQVGIWEGDKSLEWTEEGGFYWHQLGERKVGFSVAHSEFARRYIISGLSAL